MLRAISEGLVFPPGCFVVIGAVALALGWKRLFKAARLASICILSSIWICSTEAFAYLLGAPLEASSEALGHPEACELEQGMDAVVVLGGGSRGGAPDEGGLSAPNARSISRLAYGIRVARASGLPLVLSGGNPFGDLAVDSEAEAMARVAIGLGFPEKSLHVEPNSPNTEANARELKVRGYVRVVLVTSAIHMPRARKAFERQGIETFAAPCDYRFLGRSFDLTWILPSPEGLGGLWAALHESLGLLFG